MTCFNNGGALPGVTTIFQALCYQAAPGATCREKDGIAAGAKRAADLNVYWGVGGLVDSVIDITHNVVVPFGTTAGGTWGILNQSAANPGGDASASLTNRDFGCVEPFRTYAAGGFTCAVAAALSNTAVPGPVGFFSGGGYPPAVPVVPAANPGFAMYISGDMFTFELTGGALPAQGTVWALRQYVGAIVGGQGAGGDYGPYQYSNPEEVLPLTAVGAELRSAFNVQNVIGEATRSDLTSVHTVPDPYYVQSKYEASTEQKVLKFVGLPQRAIIRIYSSSGVLVRLLEHDGRPTMPRAVRRAVRWTGTSGTGTTRWSPVGCTSITSKPAAPAGWAASRWSTSRSNGYDGGGPRARPNLQEIDIYEEAHCTWMAVRVRPPRRLSGGGGGAERHRPADGPGRQHGLRHHRRPSSCCSARAPGERRSAARSPRSPRTSARSTTTRPARP